MFQRKNKSDLEKLPHYADIPYGEFEYIANTSYQANEDRTKVANYYLITIGSVLASIVSFQFTELFSYPINIFLSAFFFLITLFGIITVMQLATLRVAWFSSVKAMNHLKSYYASHLGKNPSTLFLWEEKTAPKALKPISFSFLLVVQVMLLSAASAFIAGIFLGFSFPVEDMITIHWWLGTLVLVITVIGEFLLYRYILQEGIKKMEETKKMISGEPSDENHPTPAGE